MSRIGIIVLAVVAAVAAGLVSLGGIVRGGGGGPLPSNGGGGGGGDSRTPDLGQQRIRELNDVFSQLQTGADTGISRAIEQDLANPGGLFSTVGPDVMGGGNPGDDLVTDGGSSAADVAAGVDPDFAGGDDDNITSRDVAGVNRGGGGPEDYLLAIQRGADPTEVMTPWGETVAEFRERGRSLQ